MLTSRGAVYDGYSSKGYISKLTIDFSQSLDWQIPFSGTWQGDEKHAKTFVIKNSQNKFDITIKINNREFICPAYAIRYINISGELCAFLTSPNKNVLLQTEILTWAENERIENRTDSFLSDSADTTIGIWNFEGADGLLVAPNLKTTVNDTSFIFGNNSKISKTRSKYGTSCAYNGGSTRTLGAGATIASSSSNKINPCDELTVEFDIYFSAIDLASDSILQLNGVVGAAISAVPNVSGLYAVSFASVPPSSSVSTGAKIKNGEWATICFVYIRGTLLAFLNGENVGVQGGVTPLQITGTYSLFEQNASRGDMFVDNLRITNKALYLDSYTPKSTAFEV